MVCRYYDKCEFAVKEDNPVYNTTPCSSMGENCIEFADRQKIGDIKNCRHHCPCYHDGEICCNCGNIRKSA